jgi:hypothetical protein
MTPPLKVYKRENFLGCYFEFFTFLWLVIPGYYFLRKNFSLEQYKGSYDTGNILSIRRKRISCQIGEKKIISKNSNMTPLNFVKIVFRNLVF